MDKETRNTVLTVGGIGLGLLAISKMFGGLGTFLRGGVKPEDVKYVKDKYETHKDLIVNLGINQSKLQFSRATYKKIAELQRKALVGAGTNEEILFLSLEGLNADDLKVVFMDFGLQARGADFIGFTRMDLIDWYNKELSGKDLEKMRTIWKPTGLMQWQTN